MKTKVYLIATSILVLSVISLGSIYFSSTIPNKEYDVNSEFLTHSVTSSFKDYTFKDYNHLKTLSKPQRDVKLNRQSFILITAKKNKSKYSLLSTQVIDKQMINFSSQGIDLKIKAASEASLSPVQFISFMNNRGDQTSDLIAANTFKQLSVYRAPPSGGDLDSVVDPNLPIYGEVIVLLILGVIYVVFKLNLVVKKA